MIEKVVVSMAQLNQTAGDLEGNFKRIAEAAEKAKHFRHRDQYQSE